MSRAAPETIHQKPKDNLPRGKNRNFGPAAGDTGVITPPTRLAMLRITSSRFVALVLGLCTSATPAEVKLARMFVAAASGADDDDCSRLTPCRTSAAALSGKIRAT